jgi:hypothetical protein
MLEELDRPFVAHRIEKALNVRILSSSTAHLESGTP